jgi:hypothetical protein
MHVVWIEALWKKILRPAADSELGNINLKAMQSKAKRMNAIR